MKRLMSILLLSVSSMGVAFADAGSHDYSTNIFAGGDVGWYADTMALPSLPSGGQQSSYQNNGYNNSYNNGYNSDTGYSDRNSGYYQNHDDSSCNCDQD